jgi:hypothetical protein
MPLFIKCPLIDCPLECHRKFKVGSLQSEYGGRGSVDLLNVILSPLYAKERQNQRDLNTLIGCLFACTLVCDIYTQGGQSCITGRILRLLLILQPRLGTPSQPSWSNDYIRNRAKTSFRSRSLLFSSRGKCRCGGEMFHEAVSQEELIPIRESGDHSQSPLDYLRQAKPSRAGEHKNQIPFASVSLKPLVSEHPFTRCVRRL